MDELLKESSKRIPERTLEHFLKRLLDEFPEAISEVTPGKIHRELFELLLKKFLKNTIKN